VDARPAAFARRGTIRGTIRGTDHGTDHVTVEGSW
jgi:hypothetical protein